RPWTKTEPNPGYRLPYLRRYSQARLGPSESSGPAMALSTRLICAALGLLWLVLPAASPAAADAAFTQWLTTLWPAAQQLGVSRATFDLATRGLEPDLTLPDFD